MAATRILFVGNSLTYWRPGLDALLRSWGFDAAAVTEGGATLQVLWDAGTALKAIRSGQYGFVVLQDDMPEYGGAAAASPPRAPLSPPKAASPPDTAQRERE